MTLKKHLYILSILSVLVCSDLYAQLTFMRYLRYGNPESNCQGWSVQQAPNGNIIVQFRYRDNYSLDLDFGFFILNKDGDSLDTKVCHLEGTDYVEQMVLEGNNTVYATGSRLSMGSSANDAILYKIDLVDSNNNYYRHYTHPEGRWSSSKILKKGNNLYLTGYKYTLNNSNDFNLFKTDLNGTIQFDSTYVARKADFPYSSNFDNQGNILITGGSFTGSTDQARVMTMKVDTNGNEKWRTFVGIDGDVDFECRSIPQGVVQAPNGMYYISGGTDNRCDSIFIDRGWPRSLLICLDSNGNHMWTKKEVFTGYAEQYYGKIYNSLDGNLLCVGTAASFIDTILYNTNEDLLITKYDLNGNVLWYRVYGKPDYYEFLYNSTQTRDGGLILTGRYENIDHPFHDVQTYVMRLDDCGCLIPGCDPNCTASGVAPHIQQETIKLYPNPASNTLHIESEFGIESYSIYNLLGEKQAEGTSTESIDISPLSKGMYLIQLKQADSFSTMKFVKE